MDKVAADTDAAQRIRMRDAYVYRDGLMIALLAVIPLRRRTFAALEIDQHLVKTGDLWALDIPAEDTKTRRPLEFPILKELSARIDVYLGRYRRRIPGADTHKGLWASHLGGCTCAPAIGQTIRKRTSSALGFGVSPHRFRHAAASLWAIHDPANVRGAKDLLGHASLLTTEKHYIMAQSRLAGRALAHAVDKCAAIDRER
jgi:integrase/recombinase XerD